MKNTPLRTIRKSNGDNLKGLKGKLGHIGCLSSISNLSLLERGKTWPSKFLVDSIVRIYEISEMEILYPERFNKGNKDEE